LTNYWQKCESCHQRRWKHCDSTRELEKRATPEAGCHRLRIEPLVDWPDVVEQAKYRYRHGTAPAEVAEWLAEQYLELMRDELLRRRHGLQERGDWRPPPKPDDDEGEDHGARPGLGPEEARKLAASNAAKVVEAFSYCPDLHKRCDHCRYQTQQHLQLVSPKEKK
jgi:hypothetical protein